MNTLFMQWIERYLPFEQLGPGVDRRFLLLGMIA